MQDRGSASGLTISLDNYRAAKIVLDQFGEDAERQALGHIDRLFEAGDHDGVARWMSVLTAIQQLRQTDAQSAAVH